MIRGSKGVLRDKKANVVNGTIVVTLVLFIFIFIFQVVNILTAGFTVRQRSNYSLSLLEANITQDIYSSLTEKNFDYYKELVLDTDKSMLKQKYNDLFFTVLKENLNYNKNSNSYVGNYFEIENDSVILNAVKNNDNSIKITLTMTVHYKTIFPFVNKKVDFIVKKMTVSSDYSFNDVVNENDDKNLIKGHTEGYGDKEL